MRKPRFILVILAAILLIFLANGVVLAQTENNNLETEQTTIERANNRLLPAALPRQRCSFFARLSSLVFGGLACGSEKYQNLSLSSSQGVKGEEDALLGAEPAAGQNPQVQGISIDPLGFIRKVLVGREKGALNIYFPHALGGVSGNAGAVGVREGVNNTEMMLLPAALQTGEKNPEITPPPGFEEEAIPTGQTVQPTPQPGQKGVSLWYTIDYRNPDIGISQARKDWTITVMEKYYPRSPIRQEWDKVYNAAVAANWSPAFVIAIWIEESGAGGVKAWDLGCRYAKDGSLMAYNDIDSQLECFLNKKYADPENFEKFMCFFSEGHYPCTFDLNPNFARRTKNWFDELTKP